MEQEQIDSAVTEQTKEDRSSNKDARYKEGDILSFVKVRFPGNSRSFAFSVESKKAPYGQKVVAMSDRGMAVGYVNSFPYDLKLTKDMFPIKSISKLASDDDLEKEVANFKKQKEFEVVCQDLIEKYKLNMNLTHVELTQFGKKVVFYFNAPARVDFRDLVKELVGQLKLRIELRQISVRDRAAAIGNIGPCGRELCCSSFLSKYGNANIRMAKNQNLSINFSKLNGVCGQLKCCLKYEDEVYTTKRRNLPTEGKMILTHSGHKGRVEKLHLLSEQFDMICDDGTIRRFVAEENKEELKDFSLPKRFDHVSLEVTNVIGLDRLQRTKQDLIDKALVNAEVKGKTFATDTMMDTIKTSDILKDFITEEELTSRVEKAAAPTITPAAPTITITPTVSITPAVPTPSQESTEPKEIKAEASTDTPEKTEDKEKPHSNNKKNSHRHHKGNHKKKNFKKRD